LSAAAVHLPQAAINQKSIDIVAAAAVSFGVFLAGFVIREPAPYELYMAGLIGVWALLGLRIPLSITPLLLLLVTFNIGGMISMTQVADLAKRGVPLYLAVSLFLAFTAVFLAAVIAQRPNLYLYMFRAWTLAALLTGSAGIIGYFHALPGFEAFTLYDRAAGVFQDPNVFGPFLVLPGIWLLYRLLTGGLRDWLYCGPPLAVIVFALLLSFSRGAWGLFGFSSILIMATLFLRSQSGAFRLRLVMMSVAAFSVLVIGLLIALQFPAISELFTTRAQLVQEYDGARLGRFARYTIGFMLATEHPLGIGPLEFGQIYGEDTHNIWLKALMDYGWLGFASWLTMIVWTLAGGFKIMFRERPWQPYLLCAWVTLVGHVALGTVIDTDHWRHFYLLIGMVWGAFALEARYGADYSRQARAPALRPQVAQPAG
jgi:O-antigen ligase